MIVVAQMSHRAHKITVPQSSLDISRHTKTHLVVISRSRQWIIIQLGLDSDTVSHVRKRP